jgi:UrcA family protein
MDVRKLACVGAAVFVGTLMVTATASLAQPPVRGSDVLVEKTNPLVQHVSFADLSLATKPGQKVLFHRVNQAVGQVCPDYDEEGYAYDVLDCKDFAWAGARPQIRRAIDSALSGNVMTMSISVTAAAAK